MPVEARKNRGLRLTLTYTFLIVVGFTTLLPLVWMVISALKPGSVFREYDVWWQYWIPGETVTWVELDGKRVEAFKLGTTETGEVRVRLVERISDSLLDPHQYRETGEITVAAGVYHRTWQRHLRWKNFSEAWQAVNMGRGYGNSLLVALLMTAGVVLTSSLAAFAFARLEFYGRQALFFGYLATMMIPGAVTMIPVYVLFARAPAVMNEWFETSLFSMDLYLFGSLEVGRIFGINSYAALILPGMFSAFGTFMLRQFFMGIPKDLEDSARIDGCTSFGVYRHIALPFSKPALATLTIITFMGAWKNFMWPLVVGHTQAMQTLPVMLSQFMTAHSQLYNLLLAGSLLMIVPEILVFVCMQRYFIEGIRLGAVKG